MEHELTILIGPLDGFHDEIHVMARMDLDSFEDQGLPDDVSGTLLQVPDQMLDAARSPSEALVVLGGATYRFADLHRDGTFQLRKDSRISPQPVIP